MKKTLNLFTKTIMAISLILTLSFFNIGDVILSAAATVEIKGSPTDVVSNQQFTIDTKFSVNPNPDQDNLTASQWETLVIDVPDNVVLNESFGLSVKQDPNLPPLVNETSFIDAYDSVNSQFVFTVNPYSTGQVISILFVGTFDTSAKDLDTADFTVTAYSGAPDNTTATATTTITFHDPITLSITKTRDAAPYPVVVGDEVTYTINASLDGSEVIPNTANIYIIDNIASNVTYVSSSPNGIYDSLASTVTWSFTPAEIDARLATRQITVKLDDTVVNGDSVTNNAVVNYPDRALSANSSVTDIVSDRYSPIIPNAPVKVAHPESNTGGTSSPLDGEILWTFENIDIEGVGTMSNFQVVDYVPIELQVKRIYFGDIQAPNSLKFVEINYKNPIDVAPLIIDPSLYPSGYYDVPLADQDQIDQISFNYGDVVLPFLVGSVSPGIVTIPDPSVTAGDSIQNNTEFRFDTPLTDGDGNSLNPFCPEPFIEVETTTPGVITCSSTSGETVFITDAEIYAGLEKTVLTPGTYHMGDIITYQITIANSPVSPSDFMASGVYDILPDGEEFVSASVAEVTYDSVTNSISYVPSSAIAIAPGATYTFTYQVKIIDNTTSKHTNKAYVTVAGDSNLLLAMTGSTIAKEPIDFDGNSIIDNVLYADTVISINIPKVDIVKTNIDANKVYLPESIDPASSEITYEYTFTNVDLGGYTSPIVNPSFIDYMPTQAYLIKDSVEVISSDSSFDLSNLTITDSQAEINDITKRQTVNFDFVGSLSYGESITVRYKLKVKNNVTASEIINEVNFIADSNVVYDASSTFKDIDNSGIIQFQAAQSIVKEVSSTEVQKGGQVQYNVNYTNTGTVPLTDIVFSDELPNTNDDRGPFFSGSELDVVLIQLPIVTKDDVDISSTLIYQLTFQDGSTQSVTQGNFQTIIDTIVTEHETTGVTNLITTISIDFNTLIVNPGEVVQFSYFVLVPLNAVDDSHFYNDASFSSNTVASYGPVESLGPTHSNQTDSVILADDITKCSIGDFVYNDVDRNDSYDSLVDKVSAGVLLTLFDTNNNILSQTRSNLDGNYYFNGLDCGVDYVVKLTDPLINSRYLVYDDQTNLPTNTINISSTSFVGQQFYDADFSYIGSHILGTVYYDINGNARFDSGEQTVNEFDVLVESTISLFNDKGILVATQQTVNGSYEFVNLPAGKYTVTSQSPLTSTSNSKDFKYTSAISRQVDLPAGNDIANVNFGVVLPSQIQGNVWYDIDTNSLMMAGELNNSTYNNNQNFTMNIYNSLDVLVGSTTTDINGFYAFIDLIPGDYYVKMQAFNGVYVNGGDSVFVDGKTANITLADNIILSDYNGGIYEYVSISGNFYEDMDLNYKKTGIDLNVSNSVVTLNSVYGTMTTTTDASGNYSFNNLEPNTIYTLQFVEPNNKMFIDGSLTLDTVIDLSGSASVDSSRNVSDVSKVLDFTNQSASVFEYATITGSTMTDKYRVGTIYKGDALANTNITLVSIDALGVETTVATTVTDINGEFSFIDLLPGKYTVYFETPVGYTLTVPKNIPNANFDSDVFQIGTTNMGKVLDFTILSGQTKDENGGYYIPVNVGGYIYEDSNFNSILDSGEIGFDNYTVTLTREIGASIEVSTTQTNVNGFYEFKDITPGIYYMSVETPTGYIITTQLISPTDNSSDIDINGVTPKVSVLSGVDNYQSFDAGFYQIASVSGQVFLDTNTNLNIDSDEILFANRVVDLYDLNNVKIGTTTTDVNGYYVFIDLIPGTYKVVVDSVSYLDFEDLSGRSGFVGTDQNGESTFTLLSGENKLHLDAAHTPGSRGQFIIGDYVWNDDNLNGLQDVGEIPMVNVTVNLLKDDGSGVFNLFSTTITDSLGNYYLYPDTTGNYIVEVIYPSGYISTIEFVGSDIAIDSDALLNGQTPVMNVTTDTLDVDFGLILSSEINGIVYDDVSIDGQFNGVDVPYAGQIVTLYYTDSAGNIVGPAISSTTTDINGYYEFTGLRPNNYKVWFGLVPVVPLTPYYWYTDEIAPLPENLNGLHQDLSSNAYRDINLGYNEVADNENAGFYSGSLIAGIVYEDVNYDGSFTKDLDIIRVNEVVQLFDEFGNFIEETVTTDRGYFKFRVSSNTNYQIRYNLNTYHASIKGNSDTLFDNDIDASGNTNVVYIGYGDVNYINFDIGIFLPGSIAGIVYEDVDNDGEFTSIDLATSDINVGLIKNDGTCVLDSDLVDAISPIGECVTTLSDSDGNYSFTSLFPGQYKVTFDIDLSAYASTLGIANNVLSNDMLDDFTTNFAAVLSDSVNNLDYDGGYYYLSELSGYIYENSTNIGELQSNSKMLSNYQVMLLKDGIVIDSTVTDSTGYYSFSIVPGKYRTQIMKFDYSVANLGKQSTIYSNDMNQNGITNEYLVLSRTPNNVDFDGVLYHNTLNKTGFKDQSLLYIYLFIIFIFTSFYIKRKG